MSLDKEEKIPLPNNPYCIHNGGDVDKVVFPKYIARILGMDRGELREDYVIDMFVDREDMKIELNLVKED
ncbi:MAG: hypothetical protein BTN85_0812 [Candidatus Methanohalarchaeum thermophilum]|uniref:Uncharacterized protein n=1 Tax=Methanohalarchaeum thermophilum TaxID=1903181 RepID=A0A1Q6DVE9_METT1|nr:MAG: hypothetical protein BTN85_0812 [Candidatus Methanohalarchaeum thermophilum]